LSCTVFVVPGGFVAELTLDSQQLFFFHEYALQASRLRQYAAQASVDFDSASLRPLVASLATTRPGCPAPKESTQTPPAGVVVGAGDVVGTFFSYASKPSVACRFGASAPMPALERRQRAEPVLNDIDRHVASAVHLALHSSTSATLVCSPMMLPVIPLPRGV